MAQPIGTAASVALAAVVVVRRTRGLLAAPAVPSHRPPPRSTSVAAPVDLRWSRGDRRRPVLRPDLPAAENLAFFDSVNLAVVAANDSAGGRDFIDALTAAGFDRSAMQVTADRTTVDLQAGSVQFSVRLGDECLVGQYGPESGGYHGAVRPALGTRRLSRGSDATHRLVGDMAEYIYSMVRARKAVGDKLILDDVTMAFLPGREDRHGRPERRRQVHDPEDHGGPRHPVATARRSSPPATRVGILMQEPELDETKTVLENVQEGVGPIKAKLDRFNEISLAMAEPDADFDALLAEMGTLQEEIDAADAWDLDSQLEQAMDALRTPAGRRAASRTSPVVRSAASRSAKLLLQKPDLLLLDEPTNHLDAESVLWLEQHLAKYPGAVHRRHPRPVLPRQRRRVDRRGRPRSPLPATRATTRPTSRRRPSASTSRARRTRSSPSASPTSSSGCARNAKGRQAKSKARLARYEEMAAEADRTRKLDFEEIQIPPGPRLGDIVARGEEAPEGLRRAAMLIDGLSFTLPPNGIVGVIGPNGVGKTTLFKTIVGLEPLDGGELKIGETVKICYVDQTRGGIDPNKTLWEVVSDGLDYHQVGKTEIPSRAYVSKFGFKGPDQQKKAGVLSGGERNRLNLALTLKQGGNLLLLDEPTNDLDVETLVEPRERAARVPRLRRGHHPRPVVPRPHRDAHPRLRGHRRGPGELVLVRGQLRGVRGEQDRAPRPRGREAAPLARTASSRSGLTCACTSRSRCAGATSTPTGTSTTPRCSACSKRRASRRSG